MRYNIDNDGICSKVSFSSSCNAEGSHYIWDFGDGNCQFTNSASTEHTYSSLGTYEVKLTVVDEEGCISKTTETINVDCARCEGINADFSSSCIACVPFFEYDLTNQTSTLIGYQCRYNMTDLSTPSTGSNIVSWKWTKGTSTLSTSQNPTPLTVFSNTPISPTGSAYKATVCLEILDANGCVDQVCKVLFLPCREGLKSNDGELSIFPNPSQGMVTISVPDWTAAESRYLSVFDVQGRLVEHIKLPDWETKMQLDMSSIKNGVYNFSIKSENFSQCKKVIFFR